MLTASTLSWKTPVDPSTRRCWDARVWRPVATSACCWLGYFEGIDAERGIAWRAADSLAVRSFLRLGLEEAAPDHSTISRTPPRDRCGDASGGVHVGPAAPGGRRLLKGRTIAIDATTLQANAAMQSIVRRDTGEAYQAYLTRLAAARGARRRRAKSWRGLIASGEENLEQRVDQPQRS